MNFHQKSSVPLSAYVSPACSVALASYFLSLCNCSVSELMNKCLHAVSRLQVWRGRGSHFLDYCYSPLDLVSQHPVASHSLPVAQKVFLSLCVTSFRGFCKWRFTYINCFYFYVLSPASAHYCQLPPAVTESEKDERKDRAFLLCANSAH